MVRGVSRVPAEGTGEAVHDQRNFLKIREWRYLKMKDLLGTVWSDDHGQDIAEYAVMLAVILVIVVGMIRLVGSQANNVFSETASAIAG